ncbi:MAG: ATP-binding protein [bacterium]
MSTNQSEAQSEDLEFLRRLLRDLTHEIAAPLTPLFGHLDLLELRTQDKLSPMQMRCMGAMRRSLRRLTAINDRMLEMARVERGHIPCEPVPLLPVQALTEVVRRLAGAADAREVVLEQATAAANGRKILADWNLLVMALMHLVENALRYAPAQSTVTMALTPQDGACAISVRDYGPSVPATELEKIIRPFYRVTDTEGYTETAGLGLTIVELIARRHSGRLELSMTDPEAESLPGLTATLSVPWAD